MYALLFLVEHEKFTQLIADLGERWFIDEYPGREGNTKYFVV